MLDVRNLRVEYRTAGAPYVAVHDESFAVRAGEFFTLLGPSGCGKTTTLRSVAGLETPTAGRIEIDGVPVFDGATGRAVPTHAREIAMVFQSYAIWPHMTVFENVAFPLRVKRLPGAALRRQVDEVLQMVGLGDFAERPATMLSGGQQQRVALARAIVKDAKVLLLDEPLSNLDAKLREQMRRELRRLQKHVGTTSIYVTHDQDEALSLSDRIAVMRGGRIVELGRPLDLYLRPRHTFTARFVGQAELAPCKVVQAGADAVLVETKLGRFRARVNADIGARANHLMVRPEHVVFADADADADDGTGENMLEGQIANILFSGKLVEYEVQTGQGVVSVCAASNVLRTLGEAVRLHLPPEHCVLLTDGEGGGSLGDIPGGDAAPAGPGNRRTA